MVGPLPPPRLNGRTTKKRTFLRLPLLVPAVAGKDGVGRFEEEKVGVGRFGEGKDEEGRFGEGKWLAGRVEEGKDKFEGILSFSSKSSIYKKIYYYIILYYIIIFSSIPSNMTTNYGATLPEFLIHL